MRIASMPSALPALVTLFATPLLLAQTEPAPRVHWYLERELRSSAAGDRLPVYVVIAERLTHDHWFPRVHRLPLARRRQLVVAELKAHAERTQRPVIDVLRAHRRDGRVRDISTNWLGNFVRCEATPAAIRDVARMDGVEEVRYDAAWPQGEIVDVRPTPARPATVRRVAGDGAINTRADRVWELGFTGRGVVVMNADSGINIGHGDLVNRLWQNPGEIPGNGIDDDGNGYVDDVYGWNFFDDDDDIDDGGGHGTHTAGTLVGDGSCSGTITGQAPGALVMTAALGPPTPQTGPFTPLGEVAQWDAIQYAIQMGAHIQTSSYSYKNGFVPPPNYKMHREVGDTSLAAGLIRTNSTGNNGALSGSSTDPNRIPFNVSTPGNLPPPYIHYEQTLVGAKSGVIGVGAHDVADNRLVSYTPFGPSAWHIQDVLAVNPSYPTAHWSESHNDYPWLGGTQIGLIKPDITGPTNTTTTTGSGSSCALFSQSGTSNATPRVAGTMVLWKEANTSLGPEDMAMVLHQSAELHPGFRIRKKNGYGAGRVDALNGLYLALCTHRVEGEPAWTVNASIGAPVSWEVDTVADSLIVLVLGTERVATHTAGGVLGVGGLVAVAHTGSSGPLGDARFRASVPPSLLGARIVSQWFTDDRAGVTGRVLSSNVIETTFVP